MKVISVHEPWASLIRLRFKKVETRGPGCRWKPRGWIGIHATQKPKVTEEMISVLPPEAQMALRGEYGDKPVFPHGRILCVANWSKTLTIDRGLIQVQTGLERSLGLWAEGRNALILSEVISIPQPVPFRGGQALTAEWDPPESVQQLIEMCNKEA